MSDSKPTILLTGATGYIGGRLLPRLEARGEQVRCLARQPEHLIERCDHHIEIVPGDVCDPASLRPALEAIDTAYYLVHSMGSSGSFEDQDRTAACNFAAAARAKRV